ncbi:peptidoglycan hydrolase-like protein with peptidoglycan-binding domain [Humibacillus xanthopallidus]|uniref:Peptidoglycan hydrolase-like protein with peptidoglycan-binding domain n=1 Tax=Humibacillus xanthopallidus TaxID=412689 RepID=A0A543PL97_9MICO|nr:peptidoglycan-binding protein [Humibacillus xanthopallidus]TQN44840.1 peptidoglycan hydrolase-like protein with peptidoglycan-binding domain [Humibacillus xanthopallidus]
MAPRTTDGSAQRRGTARSPLSALSALSVLALLGTLTACGPSSAPAASASAATATATASAVAPVAAGTTAVAAPGTVTAAPLSPEPAPTATSSAASPGSAASEPAQADVQGTCERTLTAYPLLEPSAKGAAVRTLQCFLNDADYGPVLVDGVYGRQTRAAVTRVESGFEGAPPHPGRIDRGMWVLLISRSMGTATLRQGAKGPEVTTLQRALRAAGGTIAVDGVFGPQTTGVVKQFQKANSITVDGVVGEETYFFLKSGGVITRG